ncbi:MAG: hypothetical protein IH623_20115 [Verrucomicrobia bacterium]|nr:hypothetical protein [Verrucomicrobiota bacterium]
MSTKQQSLTALLVIALLVAVLSRRMQDAPRRESLAALTRLEMALHSGSRVELAGLLVMPTAIRDHTAPEQSEFLAKALNDEISPEGLAVLKQQGDYGPLKKLFPAEAEAWATQAGVHPDDCVAFKLDRNGLRAEVVLDKPSILNSATTTAKPGYRIVRVNNVKQMADLKPVIVEQHP